MGGKSREGTPCDWDFDEKVQDIQLTTTEKDKDRNKVNDRIKDKVWRGYPL